ncbi:MAG: S-methyl-5-thioribose-1-phosphate isomerase [Gemmatimonadaceae bacterium]
MVAVSWSPDGRAVRIIDQRALPQQLVERNVSTLDDIRDSIRTLAVRGAPAIGVFAAMGLACIMQRETHLDREEFDRRLDSAAERIRASRPTAVNLGWAMDRLLACTRTTSGNALGAAYALRQAADAIRAEDMAMCQSIGEHALALLPATARILTHCNTGALATAGIGTALAPVYLAHRAGQRVHVYVTETRPLLQGSRLTAWELERAGIPVTLLSDNAAAALMHTHDLDGVFVGADRIAANGDVANKIGTYGLAVLARHHRVPFYVLAPTSTIDPATMSGAAIPIEQRDPNEVRMFHGVSAATEDIDAFNPAFDVTPRELITAIVTDRGIHDPPFHF